MFFRICYEWYLCTRKAILSKMHFSDYPYLSNSEFESVIVICQDMSIKHAVLFRTVFFFSVSPFSLYRGLHWVYIWTTHNRSEKSPESHKTSNWPTQSPCDLSLSSRYSRLFLLPLLCHLCATFCCHFCATFVSLLCHLLLPLLSHPWQANVGQIVSKLIPEAASESAEKVIWLEAGCREGSIALDCGERLGRWPKSPWVLLEIASADWRPKQQFFVLLLCRHSRITARLQTTAR